jgi:hypothetical protein
MRSFSATGQDGVARVLIAAAVFASVLIAAVLVSGAPSSVPGTTPARTDGAAAIASNATTAVSVTSKSGSTNQTLLVANQTGLATVIGKVTIVLCPEPAVVNPSSCQPPSTMYSTRQLVLTSSSGIVVNVPLNPDGTFTAQVPTGAYQVSISSCDFLGCDLPTPSSISIVTTSTSSLSVCFNCGPR